MVIAGPPVTLLQTLSFTNFALAVFNMVPVPPLDGGNVLGGLLPLSWRSRYNRHVPYGMFLILGLMTRMGVALLAAPTEE